MFLYAKILITGNLSVKDHIKILIKGNLSVKDHIKML